MLRTIAIVLSLSLSPIVSGCEVARVIVGMPAQKLTYKAFESVMQGDSMTMTEVKLGMPGQQIASSNNVAIYQFQEGTRIITVTFQDGVVISKAQAGLNP
jgi:hypothetical protein